MHLNNSGMTAAYLGTTKVWPTTPPTPTTAYTFVNRVYADLGTATGNNKDLQLGTPLNLSNFTLRLYAKNRQYTSGTMIGRSPTRFFVYDDMFACWDIDGESGYNRMTASTGTYGFYSGQTFNVELKNHSFYNLSNDRGKTGYTVSTTAITGDIRVRLSHLYVYEIEIKNGNTVTGFYKPAMRNSDGVYGLYNTITDTFYTTTSFTIYGDNGT